jgi:hypothetical protein
MSLRQQVSITRAFFVTVGKAARNKQNVCTLLVQNLGIDRILKHLFKKQDGRLWTDLISLGTGRNGGLL